ncbi:hypothetical protein ABZT47_09755 [Sphaerisporangium sp. NPDC005289]|uniref:hypothetical protein n=1 Tax=Sphaerisporangium sp. NPDC005289 TaxID=3155247 RepID=UPI0033AF868E
MNRYLPLGAVLGAALLAPLAVAPASASTTPLSAAGSAPTSTTAAAKPAPIKGVAVYARFNRGYVVTRFEPGKGPTRLGVTPETGQFSASPDGRKIAWITGLGKVQVSAAGKVTTLAKGAGANAPCLTPVWSPDSAKVAFLPSSESDASPVAIAGAAGGGTRRAGTTMGVCHLAWSADGRYLAGYAGTTDGVYRLDLRARTSVRVKGVKLANHVQSLSPHGERVVVATLSPKDPGGDGGWPVWFRPTIVDTTTGAKVPIAVRGRLIGALYLPDGRLVVRVAGSGHNTLVVLDASGRQLQRLAEPAQARTQALLQIVR